MDSERKDVSAKLSHTPGGIPPLFTDKLEEMQNQNMR